jgi:hypothetical protein
MLRGSVLACAVLFCLPTIWQVVVDQSISVETAMVRFIVAVPVSAALLALVRLATRHPDPRVDDGTADHQP